MTRATSLALIASLAGAVYATEKVGDCAIENVKCCNEVKDVKDLDEGTASLIDVPELLGQVGLQCDQVPILGVAIQDMCKTTASCCEGTTQNGLINLNCTPIPLI
ncbi:hypothetical protein E3P99_02007 [Wallemia hederae]|uniref:Hydrophobin n=1 Tax=Wallemia hederae TaxID=1540922 RepID=A0A4T0FMG9_9BASI|nr:hypothetical protein E3P99_02007 [Wallemia hederae]